MKVAAVAALFWGGIYQMVIIFKSVFLFYFYIYTLIYINDQFFPFSPQLNSVISTKSYNY